MIFLVAAGLSLAVTIALGALIGFANMMSDAPDERGQSQVPTLIMFAVTLAQVAVWWFGA